MGGKNTYNKDSKLPLPKKPIPMPVPKPPKPTKQ